jgi:hypothetical protein
MGQLDAYAGALSELGMLRRYQGREAEARELWRQCETLYQQLSSRRMLDEVRGYLAETQ